MHAGKHTVDTYHNTYTHTQRNTYIHIITYIHTYKTFTHIRKHIHTYMHTHSELEGHKDWVTSVALVRGQSMIASCSYDMDVLIRPCHALP